MNLLTSILVYIAINAILTLFGMLGFNYGIAPLGFPEVGFVQTFAIMIFVRVILYGVNTPKAK